MSDPLPLDRPPVKAKPKQAHVDHTGPLGSPVLEDVAHLARCGSGAL